MKTTLVAVTGLSPAIVTETLVALARRKPAIIPERVVMITTSIGADQLEKQLFTPLPEWQDRSVWESLRSHAGVAADQWIAEPARVIHLPGTGGRSHLLPDIITPADNAAAADFIFSVVWDIVREPSNRLIASIAGGRKTMGALLHAAVSLIGRETDLLTHVLVDPPYDSLPGFYFPGQWHDPLLARDGSAYLAADARVHLAEIPFVPLRNRFKELGDLPGSFLQLRDSLSRSLHADHERPVEIALDHFQEILHVEGCAYRLRTRARIILQFLLDANVAKSVPRGHIEAEPALAAWLTPAQRSALSLDGRISFTADDFRKELNHLRTVLKSARWKPQLRTLVLPPFTLAPSAPQGE